MGLDTSLTEEHPPEDWLGKIDLGHDEKCTDEEKAEAPEKKMERAGAKYPEHRAWANVFFRSEESRCGKRSSPFSAFPSL
jgi:hypothetical protein